VAPHVLEESGTSAGDLAARMESESRIAGVDLPEGEWRSLSAEMLRELYRLPG
jgi:hypothetical protein